MNLTPRNALLQFGHILQDLLFPAVEVEIGPLDKHLQLIASVVSLQWQQRYYRCDQLQVLVQRADLHLDGGEQQILKNMTELQKSVAWSKIHRGWVGSVDCL